MFVDICILIITLCILFLPIAFWMYIFTSFFPYGVSRKQFLIGMISGATATLPFVYRDGFFSGNILRDVFFHLSLMGDASTSVQLLASLFLFFTVLAGCIFVLLYFFQERKKSFLASFFTFGLFLFVLLILGTQSIVFFSESFPQVIPGISVIFGDLLFVSVGGIISYYIIISFLEEGVKYLSSLSFSGKDEYFKVFQKYICMVACIALGFSFFENALYAYSYISVKGIEKELISLVFFRSIFAIILHIMSSMLFAFGFWFVLKFSGKYFTHFVSFILLSGLGIISHVFFDASLTFGYIGYVFFYIIAIYLFLSYLSVSVSNELPGTQQ